MRFRITAELTGSGEPESMSFDDDAEGRAAAWMFLLDRAGLWVGVEAAARMQDIEAEPVAPCVVTVTCDDERGHCDWKPRARRPHRNRVLA